MSKSRIILALLLACLCTVGVAADGEGADQGFGLSVGTEVKLTKGVKLQAEAEVRTQDAFSALERWTLDVGLDWKISKRFKYDVGYQLMDRYHLHEDKTAGEKYDNHPYTVSGYWGPRHRLYTGITGGYTVGRWRLSLRERYQYTHTPLQYVPRYWVNKDGNPGKRRTDAVKEQSDEHLLRSRVQASYNIKHSKFEPFASIEMLNDMGHHFGIDQMRYTLGTDYKLDKKQVLTLQWRYKDRTDSDEAGGHLITLGYQYSF